MRPGKSGFYCTILSISARTEVLMRGELLRSFGRSYKRNVNQTLTEFTTSETIRLLVLIRLRCT